MSPNWLMLIGGLAWLVGELWGVHRNAKNGTMDTTSEWVWWLQNRKYVGSIARALVFAFTASLVAHFALGWSLLP